MDDGNDREDDVPGAQLEEEPQEERGAPGSRDLGSGEPGAGPADRPSGTADADDDTSVDPKGAGTSGAPDLPTGD